MGFFLKLDNMILKFIKKNKCIRSALKLGGGRKGRQGEKWEEMERQGVWEERKEGGRRVIAQVWIISTKHEH